MNRSPGLLAWRGSSRYRLVACFAVGLTCQSALAPMAAAASTIAPAGGDRRAAARNVAPRFAHGRRIAAATVPPAGCRPRKAPRAPTTRSRSSGHRAAPSSSMPSPPLGAESLFDGDATTGLTVEKGSSAAARLELGGARAAGRTRRPRQRPREGRDLRRRRQGYAQADQHWPRRRHQPGVGALGAAGAGVAGHNVRAGGAMDRVAHGAGVAVNELALWVAGRSRSALAEAAIADRLVTELPDNAIAATAAPWTASVARVTAQGSVSAKLRADSELRAAARARVLRLRAGEEGALDRRGALDQRPRRRAEGTVRRRRVRAACRSRRSTRRGFRRGDNTIAFQPTLTEDGRGYNIRNVRIVSVPLGVGRAAGAGRSLVALRRRSRDRSRRTGRARGQPAARRRP